MFDKNPVSAIKFIVFSLLVFPLSACQFSGKNSVDKLRAPAARSKGPCGKLFGRNTCGHSAKDKSDLSIGKLIVTNYSSQRWRDLLGQELLALSGESLRETLSWDTIDEYTKRKISFNPIIDKETTFLEFVSRDADIRCRVDIAYQSASALTVTLDSLNHIKLAIISPRLKQILKKIRKYESVIKQIDYVFILSPFNELVDVDGKIIGSVAKSTKPGLSYEATLFLSENNKWNKINRGAFYSQKSVENRQLSDSDRKILGRFTSCYKGEEEMDITLESEFIYLN